MYRVGICDDRRGFYTYQLAIGEPVLIPETTLVLEITPKDNSGKRPSELIVIEKYRVRKISEDSSVWHNCTDFFDTCKFTIIPNTELCTKVIGTWQIQVYSSSKITIIPGMLVSYYYELGD